MTQLFSRAWVVLRPHAGRTVALFAIVQLVLTPIPRVLAAEEPLVGFVPLGVLVQLLISQFATSVALIVATRALTTGDTFRLGPTAPVLGAAFLSAIGSVVVALIPVAGLLVLLVLSLLFIGPPFVAQAIALEDRSLGTALSRAASHVRAAPSQLGLLAALSLAMGIIVTVILATAMGLVADSPAIARTAVISGLQPIVLGCALAYLTALELVIFETAAVSTRG